jgi:uncharacterized protein (DUF2236 family)
MASERRSDSGAAAELIRGPDSVVWRYAGDVRGLLAAGSALVLQVGHPTVAAGVAQHSDYATDPWGRLLRTLDYLFTAIYAEPDEAAKAGRQLRERHKRITGTKPDGSSYHALEPEAFTWVHATLIEQIVAANSHFARPLPPSALEPFYAEMLAIGRLHGVADGDLPPTFAEFRSYFDDMVDTRLEDSEVVRGVLDSLTHPAPPSQRLPEPAWRVARAPLVRAARLGTVGLLPRRLRERWGLPWSRGQELQLRAIGAASRGMTPVLPQSLRVMGPAYLRQRQRQKDRRRAEPRGRDGSLAA